MYANQSIPHPHGVSVFGSSLIRVSPDVAQLSFRVSRVADRAAEAFSQTRQASQAVREALARAGIPPAEVRTSSLTLATAVSGYGNDAKVIGQRATLSFQVSSGDLERLEPLLVEIVEAGAHQIDGVSFHTLKLKHYRAEARRRALAAARAKAELYAEAAGIRLGQVLHIEDRNPNQLFERGHGEDLNFSQVDDEAGPTAPGAITVAAAVSVSFAILAAG
jgi:uncharacterized protein